ncbi:putative ribonuclease H-like domain-containing protein [Tanacetum coccineum]
MVKPIWNNAQRVNHQNFVKKTHPYAKKNLVPRAVLMKSGLVLVNTARQVNVAHSKTTVNAARPMPYLSKTAHSTVKRPIHKSTTFKNYYINQRVNTVKGKKINTARPKAVVNALIDESQVLLRVPRKNNMYSIDLKNIVPKGGLTCLFAKATSDESELWHRRLGHLNFKTMNKLVKGNLVRGLPSKLFENDQYCVACQKGKQHRASCKSKTENLISLPLHLLHMDFFGPTFNETSGILKSFITGIENLVDHKIKVIRCDNGTEIKNREMNQFCEMKGILRQFSVARTPQQDGVAERRNRTLIKAARTMLADSKLPTTFWAETVNTACYVQNRVLVVKPHNKTPYELFHGRTPTLSFMRPFGCPVTILNTIDHLGKFDGKADECFFVGYSLNSKAFRVFNSRTRIVEENLHIRFSENTPNVVNLRVLYLYAVKRIFRYLKGQPKLGLWYPKDSPFDLVAYTDSDYVGASLDRKSTTGGCQFLGCRLISWQCKKQTVVANSTIEAEYVAALSCCGQPSDPSDNVADEAVYKELGDSLVRAATTASSLEAEQDSGNITKTQSKATPNESSSLGTTSGGGPRGNTLRSDEDRLKLDELMALCTTLQSKVLDLEKTKTTQANEIASLKRRVKKLEKKRSLRTHKLKRLYKVCLKTRVESYGDEEDLGEDASKQGRRINAIDADEDITPVNVQDDADNEMFDVDALNGEEVFVAGQNENVVEKVVDAAQDDIQAKIDVDYQLAERLQEQEQEQEELAVEEKAKLFQQLLKQRRKHFAAKSTEEKRNKPPTQAQQRKIMCTYLKNMEEKKPKDLKNKSFDSIQKMFDRAFKRVNTFVDFRTNLVEGSSKRAVEELKQESTKKQKVDEDKDTAELQSLMEVIPYEEEVAIDVVHLGTKSPKIVDLKIHKEGKKSYYQIVRVDGKSQILVEDMDLLLWGDLKTMFEPYVEDEIWKLQQSILNAASITAAHFRVNAALLRDLEEKLLINAAEGVNAASEEVSTAEAHQAALSLETSSSDTLSGSSSDLAHASSSFVGPSRKRSRYRGTSVMHSDESSDEGSPATQIESDMVDSTFGRDVEDVMRLQPMRSCILFYGGWWFVGLGSEPVVLAGSLKQVLTPGCRVR